VQALLLTVILEVTWLNTASDDCPVGCLLCAASLGRVTKCLLLLIILGSGKTAKTVHVRYSNIQMYIGGLMMESCLSRMCLKVIRYLKCNKIVPSFTHRLYILCIIIYDSSYIDSLIGIPHRTGIF